MVEDVLALERVQQRASLSLIALGQKRGEMELLQTLFKETEVAYTRNM